MTLAYSDFRNLDLFLTVWFEKWVDWIKCSLAEAIRRVLDFGVGF